MILGELLLAGISPAVAREIKLLDLLPVAPQEEVYRFIAQDHPQRVGWVDVNLLVSALQSGARLWTNDKGLRANADLHGRGMADQA